MAQTFTVKIHEDVDAHKSPAQPRKVTLAAVFFLVFVTQVSCQESVAPPIAFIHHIPLDWLKLVILKPPLIYLLKSTIKSVASAVALDYEGSRVVFGVNRFL